MKKIYFCLLAFALLPAAGWAENLYRVEILIFAQPAPPADQMKHFESPPALDLTEAVDFRQYSCLPAKLGSRLLQSFQSEEEVESCLNGYLRLNEFNQRMVAERIRLEKSGQYRTLHHVAWQQPVLSPDEVRPVRLTNGRNLQSASPDAPALDGTILLSRQQFLQIDVELLYHYPALIPEGDQAGSDGLLLRSSRKLRPGDLNYIDHPFIGILALITPVTD